MTMWEKFLRSEDLMTSITRNTKSKVNCNLRSHILLIQNITTLPNGEPPNRLSNACVRVK